MNVLGIGISKKRVTLALVKHRDIIGINNKTKNFELLKLQYLYIPKNTFEKISTIFYKFDNLDIIKHCDMCRIMHHRDVQTSGETLAVKEMLYLLLVEQLRKMKKKFYAEKARVVQYRFGNKKFWGYKKLEPWLLQNVEGLTREMLMGRNGVLAQTVLTISTACSKKLSKYNWI